MKVLIAQTNETPRDFDGNTTQIINSHLNGASHGVDLVVTPELSIPGYLCRDYVYSQTFLRDNLCSLQDVVKATRGTKPILLVGYVAKNNSGWGKPVYNRTAVIQDGVILDTYDKQLLPFYDVFDEGRYFQPGDRLCVIKVAGIKFGICCCEDIWNDKDQDDYNYQNNPLAKYRALGVNNIISTNASPFVIDKPARRTSMLRTSFENGIGIYANTIGGQDDLVFDGHSTIVQNGMVVMRADTTNQAQDYIANITPTSGAPYFASDGDYEVLYEMLKMGLRDYVLKSGFTDVVFGSSGGIDSAVVGALCVDAFGAKHVHGIRMPSVTKLPSLVGDEGLELLNSSASSLQDAEQLHYNLGCWDYLYPISHEEEYEYGEAVFNRHDSRDNLVCQKTSNGGRNKVARENIQARKRGEIIMRFSNDYGALAITTGNKSELSVGYCTLYGDMNGGFAPINDLYKMKVYGLARYINSRAGKELIPVNIINKAPSAELAQGQTDEASLLPYPILDKILVAYVEEHIGTLPEFRKYVYNQVRRPEDDWGTVWAWAENDAAFKDFDRIIRLVDMSEFKRRQAAPGIKVTRTAFGAGRRLPIIKGTNRALKAMVKA